MYDLSELHDHELFAFDDVAVAHGGNVPAEELVKSLAVERDLIGRPAYYFQRIQVLAKIFLDLPPAARGPLVKTELLSRGLTSAQ